MNNCNCTDILEILQRELKEQRDILDLYRRVPNDKAYIVADAKADVLRDTIRLIKGRIK